MEPIRIVVAGGGTAGYDDWRRWVPCGTALAVASANIGDLTPCPRARAPFRGRGRIAREGEKGTDAFEALFDGDALYATGFGTAVALPTFTGTTATANFGRKNPLFRQIAELSRLRVKTPALTRGRQMLRAREETPGLLAISRLDPVGGQEILLAFNTSTAPLKRRVQVETGSLRFTALAGKGCATRASAPGSVTITLPPLGYAVCAAKDVR